MVIVHLFLVLSYVNEYTGSPRKDVRIWKYDVEDISLKNNPNPTHSHHPYEQRDWFEFFTSIAMPKITQCTVNKTSQITKVNIIHCTNLLNNY